MYLSCNRDGKTPSVDIILLFGVTNSCCRESCTSDLTCHTSRVSTNRSGVHLVVMQTSSTTAGQGGSNWQAPDWAVDFKNGLYVLEVMKDGAVVDKISLEKRRALFGRQAIMCDYVLDHPSVSRQHAVVVQHKNGG